MCIACTTVQTLKPQRGGMYIEWGNVKRKRYDAHLYKEGRHVYRMGKCEA